jgi:hypothetical protein
VAIVERDEHSHESIPEECLRGRLRFDCPSARLHEALIDVDHRIVPEGPPLMNDIWSILIVTGMDEYLRDGPSEFGSG